MLFMVERGGHNGGQNRKIASVLVSGFTRNEMGQMAANNLLKDQTPLKLV